MRSVVRLSAQAAYIAVFMSYRWPRKAKAARRHIDPSRKTIAFSTPLNNSLGIKTRHHRISAWVIRAKYRAKMRWATRMKIAHRRWRINVAVIGIYPDPPCEKH
ncbi:hypothetical protein [Paraburkholderia antibiotica]|uniref:Uncharacterized protein n=1 Tax=Paraburkholderia antibiotica TaxID=2728839 RepID=A0A7X9X365_9BURK|nr:hypothetical protein [Paraburkholderia antibiotica]NML30551.1 hypothetical protein [Paraburkholderia antibiotica]